MGQPDIQQTLSPLSVEGFDEIYQPDEAQRRSSPDVVQPDPTVDDQGILTVQIQPHPSDGVSLEDAAKLLGLHMDTVRKRLQKGKIKGFKVADKFGEKWLVSREEVDRVKPINAEPTAKVQGAPGQPQTDPIIEAQIGPNQSKGALPPPVQPDPDVKRLMSIIESQAHQLKAAGDVILYLRSQVDEKDTQLKLLTDNQRQVRWWSKIFFWQK